MPKPIRAALVGGLLVLVPGVGRARQPEVAPVPLVAPAPKFRLGVFGTDTNKGFRVDRVVVDGPGANLWLNGRRYTLETGDFITEVDGVPLTKNFTLRNALAGANGKVDLTVWSRRGPRVFEFEGVRLQRAR